MSNHSPETNKHHCVPRSFRGATNGENTSQILLLEHSAYHDFAGHVPPGFFLQRLLVDSISQREVGIPSGAFRDVIDVLQFRDWREPYKDDAFIEHINGSHETGRMQSEARTAGHLNEYVQTLCHDIALKINNLHMQKFLPLWQGNLALNAKTFFEQNSVAEAAVKYLMDKSPFDGKYKWVHSMRDGVREELCRIFRTALPRIPDAPERSRYRRLLFGFQCDVQKSLHHWQPYLPDYLDSLDVPQA